jgi:palmitoyltransferase
MPGVKYGYCSSCKCIKPPRSHHCNILGKCVLEMDHFCPWMNNCVSIIIIIIIIIIPLLLLIIIILILYYYYIIHNKIVQVGYKNYRYFINFLIYMSIGAFYLIFITATPFLLLNNHERSKLYFSNHMETSCIVYTFTLALSAFVSVLILLIWHIYLFLTNQVYYNFLNFFMY